MIDSNSHLKKCAQVVKYVSKTFQYALLFLELLEMAMFQALCPILSIQSSPLSCLLMLVRLSLPISPHNVNNRRGSPIGKQTIPMLSPSLCKFIHGPYSHFTLT